MTNQSFVERNKNVIVYILFLLAIFVRVFDFGEVPSGLNQDEAFSGYEAFSMMNYGMDSHGYSNPSYLVTWGSGMNALQSYLAIPFMKIFGVSVISLRLPQLILNIISLWVFYSLLKKIFSVKTAIIGLFVLAISPWHIMCARWALESNILISFLLFALFFFIKGTENEKFFVVSAVMYGLALYSYALSWLFVPLTLALFFAYLIYSKRKIFSKYILISIGVLFVFAVPHILFLLINDGFIPEIKTAFFSVPKLVQMRESEISLSNLFQTETYVNFFNILINQNDGLNWNSTEKFGLFYKFSNIFMAIGLGKLGLITYNKLKNKEFSKEFFIILAFAVSIFTCLIVVNLNVNKANSLHMFSAMFITLGIGECFEIFKKYKAVPIAILLCFTVSFASFCSYYFGDYKTEISYNFNSGVGDCVEYFKTMPEDEICVASNIFYSQILFFDQTPTDDFLETVEYTNYPSAFLSVSEFTNYKFGIDYSNLMQYNRYIINASEESTFKENGFNTIRFKNYCVAYK